MCRILQAILNFFHFIIHYKIFYRSWCANQRASFKKGDTETSPVLQKRVEMLKEINFEFEGRTIEDVRLGKWMKRYEELKEYSETHDGSSSVPSVEPHRQLFRYVCVLY